MAETTALDIPTRRRQALSQAIKKDGFGPGSLGDLSEMFESRLNEMGLHPLQLTRDVVRFYCRSWAKDRFALGATSFIQFDRLPRD